MSFPMSSLLFFFSLLSGTFLSISSPSWFGAWLGLELNLLSFIPLITIKMSSYLSEAAIKYFLVQALASTVIIMASSLSLIFPDFSFVLILLALILKVGAAPFHFWFPQIMEGLSWPQAIVLMTIQKIAPMFLISYLTTTHILTNIIILVGIMSALIGALGGLNVMKLRKLMAFSSINHMSWMLISISVNDTMWMVYFLFYTVISSSVILFLHSTQSFSFSDLLNSGRIEYIITLILPMSLLSLGGLPPFSGFLPKWIMIQLLISNGMLVPLVFLLFSSLLTLYFYIRILVPFILTNSPLLSFNIKNLNSPKGLLFPMLSIFNIFGLFLPIPFLMF
uniref:NADH-ubiquinone oxidoreductase chain 2 n=1 Tax=Ovalipes punctatus TaxID=331408 RepID=A0A4Y5SHA7_OVAPU|nr:NADH dehydrogenase subunit 2 [Ovalipes punctatus]QDA22807.1 NADH dehydrogenase subunit 2 [Ovalipes punctatus]